MHFHHQNTPDKMIAKLSNEFMLQESILADYAIYHHIHDLYASFKVRDNYFKISQF